jgi:hypothetical protein
MPNAATHLPRRAVEHKPTTRATGRDCVTRGPCGVNLQPSNPPTSTSTMVVTLDEIKTVTDSYAFP